MTSVTSPAVYLGRSGEHAMVGLQVFNEAGQTPAEYRKGIRLITEDKQVLAEQLVPEGESFLAHGRALLRAWNVYDFSTDLPMTDDMMAFHIGAAIGMMTMCRWCEDAKLQS